MKLLDNNEALNSIAGSLESIANAVGSPNGGSLSTFQEMIFQLNEIQNALHSIQNTIKNLTPKK